MLQYDLKRVQNLKQIFPKAILYSELKSNYQLPNTNILIIDSIGLFPKSILIQILQLWEVVFTIKDLHNILEAATFGVPVIFGNQYKKNPEADALIAQNGGKSFAQVELVADFVLELSKIQIFYKK